VELKGYSRSIRLPALLIASAIFPSLLWIISRINSISTTAFMSKVHFSIAFINSLTTLPQVCMPRPGNTQHPTCTHEKGWGGWKREQSSMGSKFRSETCLCQWLSVCKHSSAPVQGCQRRRSRSGCSPSERSAAALCSVERPPAPAAALELGYLVELYTGAYIPIIEQQLCYVSSSAGEKSGQLGVAPKLRHVVTSIKTNSADQSSAIDVHQKSCSISSVQGVAPCFCGGGSAAPPPPPTKSKATGGMQTGTAMG